jgi:hypothetical protein
MAKRKAKKLPFGGKKAPAFGKGKVVPKGTKSSAAGVKTSSNFGARMAAARAKKKKKGK